MPANVSATYKLTLTHREPVAEETMAFYLEKPKEFQFTPGQYIDVTLLDPPATDAEGDIRSFSLVSAPFEDHITFATRMRNTAFKRVLKSSPPKQVKVDGPMGSFTLHKNSLKPAVFLAGGIGITPFLSMLRQAAHDKLTHKLCLFYSNRRPEDAAFLEDLRKLEEANQHFQLVPTMTDMSGSHLPWKGHTSLINRQMLSEYLPDLHGPIYYTAGPPTMVAGLRQMLIDASVDEDDIRSEDFAGY